MAPRRKESHSFLLDFLLVTAELKIATPVSSAYSREIEERRCWGLLLIGLNLHRRVSSWGQSGKRHSVIPRF